MRRTTVSVVALCVCLLFGVKANAADDGAAFRRAAVLQRGINLSGWFDDTADNSPQRAESWITASDLSLIHDSGLQYVRLGIDPALFLQHGFNSPEAVAGMAHVDLAVGEILQAGLAVDIAVFPHSEYKQQLSSQAGVDRFVMLWQFLARHFAARDPERVFLEVLNEPEMSDPYRWIGVQATTIAAIRKIDATRTIIATAARYSGLEDLLLLQPVRDANVIYNFHFYEPYPFTHQGATWGSSEWNYFHDIPYPATPETLHGALPGVQDDHSRYLLFLYGAAGWNEQSILARLQFARDWADEHRVPVICNEFGAYKETTPPDSRARYIHDVRADAEKLHIGWAMWDYRGGFGLITRRGDVSMPDPKLFEALGLHQPR